jgi:putative transposase
MGATIQAAYPGELVGGVRMIATGQCARSASAAALDPSAYGPASDAPRACLPNLGALTGDDWPVTRMSVISDEFWAAVESVMPSDVGKRGNRFGDHRLILEGIAWRFRTGSPWRDLPADFGPWQTVWKRHHRWSLDGTYDLMFAQVAAVFGVDAGLVEDLEKLLSVDSTSVRAHQHCAGARSDTLATGGSVELQESA